MIILDENYAIDADAFQYILKRKYRGKNRKTGEPVEGYTNKGYYTRLNTALAAYSDELDREIVQSGSMSLTDALNAILESREQVKQLIREALPEVSE